LFQIVDDYFLFLLCKFLTVQKQDFVAQIVCGDTAQLRTLEEILTAIFKISAVVKAKTFKFLLR